MNALVNSDELASYYKNAQQFDDDRVKRAERSERRAWVVAGIAVAAAAAACFAVAALSPLRTVEPPVVVQVDRTTGWTDVITRVDTTQRIEWLDATKQYYLKEYVKLRESFNYPAREDNFNRVTAMSAPAEAQRWAEYYNGTRPESPQLKYGQAGYALIDIISFNYINQDKTVATIRFRKREYLGRETKQSYGTATLTFATTPEAMRQQTLNLNAIGLQVSSYSSSTEAGQ